MKLKTFHQGAGPRVLFLHGIGSSGTAWARQMDLLGDEFNCLALDLPGYGDSPDLVRPGLDAVCEAVSGVLEGRAHHVVGVSFGALTALRLATLYPLMVRSLVLADATLGRNDLPPEEKARWLAGREQMSEGLQTLSHQRAMAIAAPGAPAEVIDEIAQHMRRARPSGYLAVARIIAATDARPWLSTIQQPALVLYGEEDGVTGAEMSHTLSTSLARATTAIIPKVGHAPHLECPEIFARHTREFLRSIAGAARPVEPLI